MSVHPCPILKFLSLVDGSWRNAVFIDSCSAAACREGTPCQGYLFTTDRDGTPVLIPADVFQLLFGEQIDPAECIGHIQPSVLESMYQRKLLWQCDTSTACGVRQLAALQVPLPCAKLLRDQHETPVSHLTLGGDEP